MGDQWHARGEGDAGQEVGDPVEEFVAHPFVVEEGREATRMWCIWVRNGGCGVFWGGTAMAMELE